MEDWTHSDPLLGTFETMFGLDSWKRKVEFIIKFTKKEF